MMDKLEEAIEDVKSELSQPIPEVGERSEAPPNKPKGAKKVAKKAVKKKVAKKKGGASAEKQESGISLKDLATEAKITEQRARQKLREAEVKREGRWVWAEGSRDLQTARKALGLS